MSHSQTKREHSAGKGSRYRKVDHKRYADNYEKIFGAKDGRNTQNKKEI